MRININSTSISAILLPIFVIFVGCASADVSPSTEKSTQIIYTQGKNITVIDNGNPQFSKLLEECNDIFTKCPCVLDKLITENQLNKWKKGGAVELIYDCPRRVDFSKPIDHSYQITRLIIPLKDYDEKGLCTKVVAYFLPHGTDIFVNNNYNVANLEQLVLKALEHKTNKNNIESNDIESCVSELIKQKNYAEAIKAYQSAIESTKDKAAKSQYYYNLGMVYKLLADKNGQIDALRNAANTTPDLSVRCDYLEVLGKLLIDSKQIEEAKKIFQEVSAKSKKDWQKKSAQFNLLRIEQAEGKLDARIKSLENQLKDSPQDSNTLQDLAIIYDQILKDYAKANPVYEKLSNLQPDNLQILSRLQFCYEEQGQIDKSLAIYEKLMEKDPKSSQKVLERTLKLAISAKQPQTAIRWGKKYVEAEPNDPNAQAILGRIAFQVEDYNLAAESLGKAESLATSSEERDKLIIEQIAVAEKQNDKESIEKNLRRVIKLTESSDTRATGFIMLVRFLQQENRLDELVTW
jgi:tetratricopeptide (TPR) repeat protein